jgi:predicted nucleotidyltransferase
VRLSDAIASLRHCAPELASRGAKALFLYGSTTRDEAGPDSDLDLFIDYDADSAFNAFDLVGLKLLLEEQLSAPVDLTTRDGLHPMLRGRIEASAIRVF